MLVVIATWLAALAAAPSADARFVAVTADAPPPPPLTGVSINLDAGHNPGNAVHAREINRIVDAGPLRKACDTTGTQTSGGYTEARYTLAMAAALASELRAQGATVTFTHTATEPAWGPCINRRAALGNHADLAFSLHADGSAPGNRGFHVIRPKLLRGYTDDIAGESNDLAVSVRNELRAIPRGIPVSTYIGRAGIDTRGDLGGLNLSNVPKVFIEQGNMKNAADAAILQSPAQRTRIARAVTRAVVSWHAAHPA